MNGQVDRELGSVDARLEALEGRMSKLELQQAEMLRVLYMGRGIAWVGSVVAAFAAVIWTTLQILSSFKPPA